MSDQIIQKIQASVEDAIRHQLFSCAQVTIADAHSIIASLAVGNTRISQNYSFVPPMPVTERSLFDIASITKPVVTAALVMKAVDEGVLSFDQKLISIPQFIFPPWLLGDSIAELLSHQTQLPAWIDFHGATPRVENHEQARDHILSTISRLSPRDDGTTWCYSDLGYMLLGFILELVYGKSLDAVFREKIAEPLGLENDMVFTPLRYFMKKEIPATCPMGNDFIQGHPDDANARSLSHIAGHAGLFASARAITIYIQKLLACDFPVSRQIIAHCLNYHSELTPFALGWDRPTTADSLSGRMPSDPVLGHLGFTGCSVWFDLNTKRIVTFLTNRTHTNADPKSISELRRSIYKLAWSL